MKGLDGFEKIDILAMMFQRLKGVLEMPKEKRGQMELDKESLQEFLVLEGMPAQNTSAKEACEMLSKLRVLQLARTEAEKEAAAQHQQFKECLEMCVMEEVEDIFGHSMR